METFMRPDYQRSHSSQSQVKPLLSYVMPEYDSQSHTHFAYLAEFVKELAKHFDIFLVIEKGERPKENFGCKEIVCVRSRFFPLKFFELWFRLFAIRLKGCRTFYVHYSFLAAFAASSVARISRGKVFYWNCGLPWQYRRGFFRESGERVVYKMISYLVTGTESLKTAYAEHYHLPLKKVKVMPNWIDIKNFQFPISNFQKNKLKRELDIKMDQKIILFVHRLSKRKGVHFLPEILDKLRTENVVLLVVGDGPERESLESRVSNLELGDKVRFLGSISNSQLPNYYLLANIFIMPSEEEGFPHVLLESMTAGTPFVAFNVGGVPEIIPPQFLPYVVEPGNVFLFLEKIKEIFMLPETKQASFKKISGQWVRQFDISRVSGLFKKIVV